MGKKLFPFVFMAACLKYPSIKTKLNFGVLCRFEATRQVRRVESEVNEQIKSGEVSIETFANVSHWHTPILAMTADVIQATDEECMKCGMDGYVAKPFEEEQLYSAAACFFESG